MASQHLLADLDELDGEGVAVGQEGGIARLQVLRHFPGAGAVVEAAVEHGAVVEDAGVEDDFDQVPGVAFVSSRNVDDEGAGVDGCLPLRRFEGYAIDGDGFDAVDAGGRCNLDAVEPLIADADFGEEEIAESAGLSGVDASRFDLGHGAGRHGGWVTGNWR